MSSQEQQQIITAVTELRTRMEEGFKQVTQRLDRINGHVSRHEERLQGQELKIENIKGKCVLEDAKIVGIQKHLEQHEDDAEEREKTRPSIVKAVLWIGGILGVFQAAGQFITYDILKDMLLTHIAGGG